MKFQWPGLQHRVLLIRADGAQAYAMRQGGLVSEAAFRLEELELFKGYCQSRTGSKFMVLADLVEEDFRVETIPYVAGTARQQLLARKYDQAYRNTPYRASMSLGREESNARSPESERRDERVLLMGLTNQQALNPWLEVMYEQRAQVRGVHPLPVVTGWINQYLGAPAQSAMFVTLDQAGLRQIFIDEGRVRFARLAPFSDDNMGRAGERIANEIARTEQYLSTLRWLPRDAGPLRTVLVCPAAMRAAWTLACVNTDRLVFEFPGLETLATSLGLRSAADGGAITHADLLWAAGALRHRPKVDFAPAWTREHYTHWVWRSGIMAAGAALCAAGTAAGAVFLAQANTIDDDADRRTADFTRANNEYQLVAKSFPQTGITPEYLKGAVRALDPLAMRPLTPEPLMIQISQALLMAPGFVLTKLDWRVAANAEDAPGTAARPPARPPAPGMGTAPERFEIAVLTGALTEERHATPRRQIAAARSAMDALRRIPGVEVTPVRLPLDVSPAGNLKGGDEESAAAVAADAGQVVLRIVRKVAL